MHSSHTRAVTLSRLCGAGADRKKQGHSLKEVLASKFIHKLVGSAPGRVGYVLADRIVATLLRAMVGRERRGGGSERENEGSKSANHCVVRVGRWGRGLKECEGLKERTGEREGGMAARWGEARRGGRPRTGERAVL